MNNVIYEKSFQFGLRIIKLFKFLLQGDKSLTQVYNQILRSGTSVGANVTEAKYAASKKDFINKLTIALKESHETEYWLKLLLEAKILDELEFKSIHTDNVEITKILTSIIKTTKSNL